LNHQRSSAYRPFSASILIATMAVAGHADVFTVDDDDPAADFWTIQEAVDAAVDGDRIEVGPGYYFDSGPTTRPVVEVLGKSLQIIAVSGDPSETVISGQGVRRGVVWLDTSEECRLEGFTIDGGFTNGDGGGLRMEDAKLRITECVFTNNIATGDGGAIHSASKASIPPLVLDCRFESNSAANGGATWATGGLDLMTCDLIGNLATIEGGGSFFTGNPPGSGDYSLVTSCDYLDCDARFGGGVRGSVATLWISACTFTDCTGGEFRPSGWGGGISMVDGVLDIVISDFNGCLGVRNGGAIDADDSDIDASNCTFDECRTVIYGGAVNGYGNTTTLRFKSCTFTGNDVLEGAGGAIGCAEFGPATDAASLLVDDCTFGDNLAFGFGYCINAGNVVTAVDCDFGEQQAPNVEGGACHVSLRGLGTGSRFERCAFSHGRTLDYASSIRASDIGALEFIDCSFTENRTTDNGAQVEAEGAVYIDADPDSRAAISFIGCQFVDNGICCIGDGFFSGSGGALRVEGRTVELAFCTFAGNSAFKGGSIDATAIMTNCSISGLASLGYGGAAVLGVGSEATACRFSGSADCNYPLLYGSGPIMIEGCTFIGGVPENFACNQNPADLAANWFAEGTTVRDSRFCGYDPAAINGMWTDLGGNTFDAAACNLEDLNGDGVVNGADLALILADWSQPCLGCPSDINNDGLVNGADLALVLAAWG
jgi:predicted outer membrane repeat protein